MKIFSRRAMLMLFAGILVTGVMSTANSEGSYIAFGPDENDGAYYPNPYNSRYNYEYHEGYYNNREGNDNRVKCNRVYRNERYNECRR
ncbi:hypothetical protein AYO45_01000 [Gammaproteobacteria bacterium SCGC AG-212-F23]|nr:hypothetical protein AYO45_01000 [Gammaproteobacteria bacterium SCGC AG-212-F23]